MTDEKKLPEEDGRIAPGATAPQTPSARKPLSKGQRIGMAVAAVVFVAIIGVSAFFLFTPGGDGPAASNLMQTTAQKSSASSAADASDAGSSSSAAESSDQEYEETSQLVQSGTEDVVASGAAAGSDGGQQGSTSSGTPAPQPEAPQRDVVTVTISVTSVTVGNPVSAGPLQFTFERGATVLDALVATGLSVNASNSGFGTYVSAIGGLAEDPSKGAWGWKYSVNGVDGQMSSGLYKLNDGDVIEWRYVTDLNG